MNRLALLLTLPLALSLAACGDLATGASAASDPSGIGLSRRAEGGDLGVEAGLDGMGMAMAAPEGDQVRMGVRASADQAAMGVRLDAADGTGFTMEVVASERGARVDLSARPLARCMCAPSNCNTRSRGARRAPRVHRNRGDSHSANVTLPVG